jgi:hypothetical protein
LQGYIKDLKEAEKEGRDLEEHLDKVIARLNTIEENSYDALRWLVDPEDIDLIDEYVDALNEGNEAGDVYRRITERNTDATDRLREHLEEGSQVTKDWSEVLVEGVNRMMSFASACSALKSSYEALMDPDMTFSEKFLSVLTSLSMALSMFGMAL